jgi:large subunit ribosomal protein L30
MAENQNNATAPTKKLNITLVRSPIGNQVRAKRTVKALGFSKLGETVTHPDNDSIRGMIYVIDHLVRVTEVTE